MLIYIFVVFFIVAHCTARTSWNGLFPKKVPHNLLGSSPLLEMPTWPFRPCASVGAEGSFNSVRQIALAIGLKMKKRLTNSQSRFELREEYYFFLKNLSSGLKLFAHLLK